MVPYIADENPHGAIIRELRRRDPSVDLILELSVLSQGTQDDELLEWATLNRRVLLTHDIGSMSDEFYRRLVAGTPTCGVFLLTSDLTIGEILSDLLIVNSCSDYDEWINLEYLPL